MSVYDNVKADVPSAISELYEMLLHDGYITEDDTKDELVDYI